MMSHTTYTNSQDSNEKKTNLGMRTSHNSFGKGTTEIENEKSNNNTQVNNNKSSESNSIQNVRNHYAKQRNKATGLLK